MSTLDDHIDALAYEFDKYIKRLEERQASDYYAKRKYGKWTIYNKEGWRVAWGLNENEMKNYMKLLKKED